MKKLFKGKVIKGKVVLQEQENYNLHVWSMEGKDIELTIGKPTKKRSNQENRYYWGVVIKILSDYTGYDENEMHDAMRMLFLKDQSKGVTTLRSTASLDIASFEEYMSKIRMWASKALSCYVPTPREVKY